MGIKWGRRLAGGGRPDRVLTLVAGTGLLVRAGRPLTPAPVLVP